MTNEEMQKIKDKVALLMRMGTDDRTNSFEAEAAMRQAAKLMQLHNIEVAELADATGTAPRYDWSSVTIPLDPKNPATRSATWMGRLSLGVARFTDTKASWIRHPVYGQCIRMDGAAVDIQYAAWLLKQLRDNTRTMSKKFVGIRREREDFKIAMIDRIIERMREIKKEAQKPVTNSDSKAMVLVTNKIVLRDEHFGKQKTKTTHTRVPSDFAKNAGRTAGDKVGFGRPMEHQGNRALGNV